MADESSERRYTEQEFALILRRAIELDTTRVQVQDRSPPPVLPADGITLEEIQEIAAEVGVDPVRVAEAAEALSHRDWSLPARLFGGPAKVTLQSRIDRQLTADQMGRLLEVAREVFNAQGEAHEVLGGVEWRTATRFSPISLRISPETDAAKLEIEVDRGSSAFLSHWIPMILSLMGAGITIGSLEPSSAGVVLGILGGWATAGYSVGRTVWTLSTRRWVGLLGRVRSGMADRARKSLPAAPPAPNLSQLESVGEEGTEPMLEEES